MNEPDIVEAYSKANFDEPHNLFVRLLNELIAEKWSTIFEKQISPGYRIFDIGCGTCDIPLRMAKMHPECSFDCLDGSQEMLKHAYENIHKQSMESRINLKMLTLPLPEQVSFLKKCDIAISNSTLHHLQTPMVLWETIHQLSRHKSLFFVMDLLRPTSAEEAKALVLKHAADEDPLLKKEFYNSLLAAYTLEEVQEQLQKADIGEHNIKKVSDRHFVAYGFIRKEKKEESAEKSKE